MASRLLARTPRTTLKRQAQRGSYDREQVHAILDEALVCDLAFSLDGQPYAIPTVHGRIGDTLYLHGSSANRALRALRDGARACVTATLVDGLVLGRSAFHQSINFRCVILYGPAREVEDPREKRDALRAIVEHAIPGRWADTREPNAQEMLRTLVLAIPIEEASAKVRTGPPVDEEEDYALPCWAGVIPLRTQAGPPVADPRLAPENAVPEYARAYRRPGSRS